MPLTTANHTTATATQNALDPRHFLISIHTL